MSIDKNVVMSSKMMDRIKGYLMALDDLSGCQREFSSVATLIKSKQNLLDDIKEFSTSSVRKNPQIIDRYESKKRSASEELFEEILMSKFLSGLYPPLDRYSPPVDILHEYKCYVLSNLVDLIDFSFKEIGVPMRDLERDIELALIQDNDRYFITLAIKKKPYKMLFFFYTNLYSKDEIRILYKKIKSHLQDNCVIGVAQ